MWEWTPQQDDIYHIWFHAGPTSQPLAKHWGNSELCFASGTGQLHIARRRKTRPTQLCPGVPEACRLLTASFCPSDHGSRYSTDFLFFPAVKCVSDAPPRIMGHTRMYSGCSFLMRISPMLNHAEPWALCCSPIRLTATCRALQTGVCCVIKPATPALPVTRYQSCLPTWKAAKKWNFSEFANFTSPSRMLPTRTKVITLTEGGYVYCLACSINCFLVSFSNI